MTALLSCLRLPASTAFTLMVVVSLTGLAAAPLWSDPGFLITRGAGDSPFLLWRVVTLAEGLRAGEFPVRWATQAAFGYGLPLWNFYAPLAFYLAAGAHVLGVPVVAAIKLTQTLALALAAWGVWGWTGAWGWARTPRAVAACAYTVAPMHLVNLYVRGDSLAELLAMGVFPLVFWQLHAAYAAPERTRWLGLALSVAALALAHNISALYAAPFIALYAGALALTGWRTRAVLGLVGTGLAGLALSAFFWGPALAETATVQIGVMQGGFFFYGNHFRAANLLQPTLAFDYDPGGNPFSMGLLLTLAAGLGLARGWWLARTDPALRLPVLFATLMAALTTWLVTPFSAWVWEAVPLLALGQFPWRWLTLQSLALAVLAGLAVWGTRRPRWLAVGLCAALLWAGLAGVRPTFIPLPDAHITREALWLFDALSGTQASQIGGEYLPAAAQPHPRASAEMLRRAPVPQVLAGQASGQRVSQNGAHQVWQVTITSTASLALPVLWWPGWQAHDANGQAWPTRAAPDLGWLTVDNLPPGPHTLTLRLARTPLRALAETWSLAVGLTLAVAAARAWRTWLTPRTLTLSGLMLALAGLAAAYAPPAQPTAPLNVDMVRLAFPHRDVVRFEAGRTLTHAAWDTHALTTTWQASAPFTASVQVVNLGGQTIAETEVWVQPGAPISIPLPLPTDLWGIHGLRISTEHGAPAGRGAVWLEPRWLAPAPQPPVSAAPTLLPGVQLAGHRASTHGLTALISPVWQVSAALPLDVAFSVRVADALGHEWVRADAPPSVASSLWQPGDTFAEAHTLNLPEGMPPGVYTITALAYHPVTVQALGAVTWHATLTPFTPRGSRPAQATLNPALAVAGFGLPPTAAGDRLPLTVDWLTAAPVPADTPVVWFFSGPATFTLTEHIGAPWPAQALVRWSAAPRLPPTTPPGAYTVHLGLSDSPARLPLGTLTVTASLRTFADPGLPVPLSATFGATFDLLGANFTRTADTLTVQLAWRARKTPPGEYHYFVHALAADERTVLTQADSAVRGLPHPLTDLVPGQTWVETITLNLTDLPTAPTMLAVGWYTPTPPDYPRLPTNTPDNRLLIPITP